VVRTADLLVRFEVQTAQIDYGAGFLPNRTLISTAQEGDLKMMEEQFSKKH
jgi:hypothetical protein